MTANVLTLPKISTQKLLQAKGSFEFRFEELGLELERGVEVGCISGTAEVTYWNDEDGLEWFVGDITLDGRRRNALSNMDEYEPMKLEPESRLCLEIWSVLTEGRFHDLIEARIRQDLEP